MPQATLQKKTKRSAVPLPVENPPVSQHSDDDVEMDDDTSSDEEDLPEKDETEKKLERMLFGDDEGFMGALKNQQERAAGMQLTLHSDDESGSAGEGEADEEDRNVEDMADEDVCGLIGEVLCLLATTNPIDLNSSSSSILAPSPKMPTSLHRKPHLMKTRRTRNLPLQSGTIVMTTVWLSRLPARLDCANCARPSRRT